MCPKSNILDSNERITCCQVLQKSVNKPVIWAKYTGKHLKNGKYWLPRSMTTEHCSIRPSWPYAGISGCWWWMDGFAKCKQAIDHHMLLKMSSSVLTYHQEWKRMIQQYLKPNPNPFPPLCNCLFNNNETKEEKSTWATLSIPSTFTHEWMWSWGLYCTTVTVLLLSKESTNV